MAREKSMSVEFSSSALSILLNRVHLKGLIEECVLSIKNGVGSIYAVDMSNSIFVSCSSAIGGMENMDIGLGKLSTLCKFLDDGMEVNYDITDKWLTLRKRGKGTFKVLLLEKEQVPTAVQENGEESTKAIKESSPAKFDLKQTVVDDLIYYITLITCSSVIFSVKNGIASVSSSKDLDQQFNMRIGTTDSKEEYTVEVYSQYLLSVLRSLTWSETEIPTANIGDKTPFVITQNEKNLWALTPIMS
jgi:hypothetical protein